MVATITTIASGAISAVCAGLTIGIAGTFSTACASRRTITAVSSVTGLTTGCADTLIGPAIGNC